MNSNAQELVDRLLAKYSSCASYRDSGSARSGSMHIGFETYFCRPSFFCIKWVGVESGRVQAVRNFRNGAEYFSQGKWEKQKSLGYALRIAAGSSISAAPFIGALLMPNDVKASGDLLELVSCAPIMETGETSSSVILISNAKRSAFSVRLSINVEELKVIGREAIISSGIADNIAAILPNLRQDRDPEVVHQIERGLAAPCDIEIVTQYKICTFDEITESDFTAFAEIDR